LVDDLRAIAHRGESGVRRLATVWSRGDVDNAVAGLSQRLKIGRLVLIALPSDQVGSSRPAVKRFETPVNNREIELRQMRALEEVV
jgi:hypothetical protein